jgi:hypothetical protein
MSGEILKKTKQHLVYLAINVRFIIQTFVKLN